MNKLHTLTILAYAFTIGILTGLAISLYIQKEKKVYQLHNVTNQQKWQNCIDISNGSNAECEECDYLYNYGLGLDLPEEIMQANEKDTLIAIKKDSTIFVTFR